MTTHGILALATANGWEGGTVYADAAPSRFGPAFWRDLHGPFGGDRYAWAHARVVAHPAGWVRYPTVCACHGTTPPRGHGSGALPPWLYILAVRDAALMVLRQVGDGWVVVAQVDCTGSEPDWAALEMRP